VLSPIAAKAADAAASPAASPRSPDKKRSRRSRSAPPCEREEGIEQLSQSVEKLHLRQGRRYHQPTPTYDETLPSSQDSFSSVLFDKSRRPPCTTLEEVADCFNVKVKSRMPGERSRLNPEMATKIPQNNKRGMKAMINLVDEVASKAARIVSPPLQKHLLLGHVSNTMERLREDFADTSSNSTSTCDADMDVNEQMAPTEDSDQHESEQAAHNAAAAAILDRDYDLEVLFALRPDLAARVQRLEAL
jgi:hypothetical protein